MYDEVASLGIEVLILICGCCPPMQTTSKGLLKSLLKDSTSPTVHPFISGLCTRTWLLRLKNWILRKLLRVCHWCREAGTSPGGSAELLPRVSQPSQPASRGPPGQESVQQALPTCTLPAPRSILLLLPLRPALPGDCTPSGRSHT